MALFGNADAGLPLLTQVFQLDVGNVEEMRMFCDRYTEMEIAKINDKYKFIDDEEISATMRELYAGVAERAKQNIKAIQIVCALAQSMCQDIVKENRIDKEDFLALRELDQNWRPTLHAVDEKTGEWADFGDGDYLPASRIKIAEYDLASEISWKIFAELKMTLIQQRDRLKICEECQNVFVRDYNRSDQKYCSHRCGDRVSARKRLQRKREEVSKNNLNLKTEIRI